MSSPQHALSSADTAHSDMVPSDPETGRPEDCVRGASEVVPDKSLWRLRMLEELAELSLELARAAQREALSRIAIAPDGVEADAVKSDDGADDSDELKDSGAPGNPGMLFARISRVMRQTLALHAKFEAEYRLRQQQTLAEQAVYMAAKAQRAAGAANFQAERRRSMVEHTVENLIGIEADPTYAGDLYRDLYERLDDYEAFFDFGAVSVGEMVVRLCRDMGLEPKLERWANEPWALDEIRSKPPGSPYADWPVEEPANDRADEDGPVLGVAGCGPPP